MLFWESSEVLVLSVVVLSKGALVSLGADVAVVPSSPTGAVESSGVTGGALLEPEELSASDEETLKTVVGSVSSGGVDCVERTGSCGIPVLRMLSTETVVMPSPGLVGVMEISTDTELCGDGVDVGNVSWGLGVPRLKPEESPFFLVMKDGSSVLLIPLPLGGCGLVVVRVGERER